MFTANQKVREQELACPSETSCSRRQVLSCSPFCWTQAREYLLPAKWFDLAFALATTVFTVEERPTELAARFTRAQEQLDAAVKQRAHEKSVFGVNFHDLSGSVDALQRAIVVVSARSDADGMGVVANQSKTETAHAAREVAFLKEQKGREKVDETTSIFPL